MIEYPGIKVWEVEGITAVLWRNVASDRDEVTIHFQGCTMMTLDIATLIVLVVHDNQQMIVDIIKLMLMHNTDESDREIVDEIGQLFYVELTEIVMEWNRVSQG